MVDLRYAWRDLRRSPAFTIAAVLTLAVGIGASTAVFSVVDRILFRPLPYADPDRLASLGFLVPAADTNEFLPPAAFLRIRDRQRVLAGMTAFGFISDCDLSEANPVRLRCAQVDAAFLPAFQVRLAAGRNFTNDEDSPNGPRAAILNYAFWKSRFAADPAAVGRAIPLDGVSATIVGVLPPSFELPNLTAFDVLLPVRLSRAPARGLSAVRAFARLRPAVTFEAARASLQPLFEEERSQVPPEFRQGMTLVLRPLRDRQVQDVRTAAQALLGAVGLVLLMACANVANLLLVRAEGRRREWAVRHALGAPRSRLVRQALTESLLLSGFGAVAGCGVAWALLRLFVAFAPHGLLRLNQASVDVRALLFAAVAALASGILFGVAPATRRPDPETLAGGRSVVSFRGMLRHALVAGQIAVAVVLLTGASLLLRTLWTMQSVPLGMDVEHAVAARFTLPRTTPPARIRSFFDRLETRLDRLPGVAAAAVSSSLPPFGGILGAPFSALNIEGRPRLPQGTGGAVGWRYVTPGYFAVMGISIVRGRAFTDADRTPGASAIVLNEALARRLFPGEDPVGRRIFESGGVWHTVVGIAADVRNVGLARPAEPEYYLLRKYAPDPVFGDGSAWRSAAVVVRSPLAARAVSTELRRAIAELEPTLPVEMQTLRERASEMTEQPRFNALLLGGFAAIGLALAAIGVYGVIAFLVTQRSREIGVRMALGATPRIVARHFVRHAALWTAAGTAIGLAGAWFATEVIGRLLFQVGSRDPWSFVAAPVLLFLVALAAAWIPSRRAAAVDPVRALRQE